MKIKGKSKASLFSSHALLLCGAFIYFLLCINLSATAFSDSNIISPSGGVWNNIQALVLDVSDGSDLYYSISGTDPLEQGFFYDGPVVIKQVGNIHLWVVSISPAGVRKDFFVDYTVIPIDEGSYKNNIDEQNLEEASLERIFVSAISRNPLRRYVSGTTISIPPSFLYTMEKDTPPSIQGKTLTLSDKNLLNRYVPCSLKDSTHNYNIVIHIVSELNPISSYSQKTVPFELTDWALFTFTDSSFIYQIDNSFWSANRDPQTIDRSKAHTIRWQAVDYKKDNPVYTYVLPPKPSLSVKKGDETALEFFVSEKSYNKRPYYIGSSSQKFSALSVEGGFYQTVPIDVLDGDNLKESILVGIYYDGVYQGDLSATLSIDKCPPLPPVFKASSSSSYSRVPVTMDLKAAEDADIYYSIKYSTALDSSLAKNVVLDSPVDKDFILYGGETVKLPSIIEKAAIYEITAFCVDDAGNRSRSVKFKTVVDEYNVYVDGAKNLKKGSGTYDMPFATLEEAAISVNKDALSHIHIISPIFIEKNCSFNSDCTISVLQNNLERGLKSNISIKEGAGITVKNANLSISDCIISSSANSVFYVEGGGLYLFNCEVVENFSGEVSVIDGRNSNVSIVDSGITVNADSYACMVSTEDSSIIVKDARLTAFSPSCVGIQCISSNVSVENSSCSVRGILGHCIDLFRSKASLVNNLYSLNLENGGVAVWKDADTILISESSK